MTGFSLWGSVQAGLIARQRHYGDGAHEQGRRLVDVSMQVAPLLVDGAKLGYVFTFRDIGEMKQAKANCSTTRCTTCSPDCPNRALFLDRLNLTLSRRLRHPDNGCGVPFIWISTALKKSTTDWDMPPAMCCRWQRPGACAPRCVRRIRLRAWGGDEFAVLVENIVASFWRSWRIGFCARWTPVRHFRAYRSGQREHRRGHGRGGARIVRSTVARCGFCHVPGQTGRARPL